ncbi:unnamed protein product [Prorocentrum cordatum]|uniref:Uncharacterized protein n=1 Tax=Prorocentrum cordatum TaxID=2364126 RepID=A0ABN9URB9_9DINO|nr:unnamed protein product [Polarella glacialis]
MGLEQSLRLCWHTEGAMLSDRSPMPSRSDQPGVEATKGLSNARPPAGERFKIPGHNLGRAAKACQWRRLASQPGRITTRLRRRRRLSRKRRMRRRRSRRRGDREPLESHRGGAD